MGAGAAVWFVIIGFVRASTFASQVLPDNSSTEAPFRSKSVCYDELGCFSSGGDFHHHLYRPIDLLPQDREKINTRFHLYTLDSPKDYNLLKAGDDRGLAHYKKGKPLKVIVHGYLDNQLFGSWMRELKDELLLSGDMNVVIVDWSGGNGLPYIQASANTRLVGAEIAHLITWLQKKGVLELSEAHILGHSLGSHIAGYAGERLNKIGRITAMDPAEPYFQFLPPSVRIDPTDAKFVDVIHTDTKSILLLGLGMRQLAGHVDLFPNGGKEQPGCGFDKITTIITDGLVDGVRDFVACNHQRAVSYVQDSVNRHRCLPVGFACEDWEAFEAGQCASCGPDGRDCAVMGYRADKHYTPRDNNDYKSFYLKTNSDPSYCLYHYQITMKLEKDSKDQNGEVQIKIQGSEQYEIFTLGDGKIELNGDKTYTFLLTTKKHLGDIKSAILSWEVRRLLPSIFKAYLKINALTIRSMNQGPLEKATEIRYCLSAHPIESKKSITLTSTLICDATKSEKRPVKPNVDSPKGREVRLTTVQHSKAGKLDVGISTRSSVLRENSKLTKSFNKNP